MLVVSFMTQKGGAGKTTLAFSTAVAAAQAGEHVAVLDLDPQGSTGHWAEARKRTDIHVETAASEELKFRLAELSACGFTLCVLDTASIDDNEDLAIEASDLCVIPARPNVFDLRAGEATRKKIAALGKTGVFLINQCPPLRQISRIQEGARALEASGVLISPLISARVDFQDAARAGLGVTELHTSSQAAQEIRALWASILQLVRPAAVEAPGEPSALDFPVAAEQSDLAWSSAA